MNGTEKNMNGMNGMSDKRVNGRVRGMSASMREDGRAIVLTSPKGVWDVPVGPPIEKRWGNTSGNRGRARIIVLRLADDQRHALIINANSKAPLERYISLNGLRAYGTKREPAPIFEPLAGRGAKRYTNDATIDAIDAAVGFSPIARSVSATEDKVDRIEVKVEQIESKIDRLLAMWEIKK